jgi:hemoglobin
MDSTNTIPTPYEYAGGIEKFETLTDVFYSKVLKDEILEPIFRHMDPEHSKYVARFLAEVFMGPKFYSNQFGDDALRRMVGKHVGKKLTEQQRKRWVELLMQSADETGLPNDPEFRSVFAGHIEWGTRVAIINSGLDENPTTDDDVIPTWGWGVVKGPYEVVGSLFRPKRQDESLPGEAE